MRTKLVNGERRDLTDEEDAAVELQEAAHAVENTAEKRAKRAENRDINRDLVMIKFVAEMTGKTLAEARTVYKAIRS